MTRKSLVIATVCMMGLSVTRAAQMPVEKEHGNSVGMKFVRIEPGAFEMGNEAALSDEVTGIKEFSGNKRVWVPKTGDFDERPVHKVTIARPFYMAVTEVTNQQYELFDPLHVHVRGKRAYSIDNDEAVVFVSWHDAKAFCEWLSKKEGLPYRLPTEAEWEYACRAGTATAFSSGDALPGEFIQNPDNSWYPCPRRGRGRAEVVPLHVGKRPPNPWGLHDMHGNVEEWCHDWYGPYVANDQADPVGRIDGLFRVARGGSHSTFAFYMRSANRMGALPEDRSRYIGFRVVLGALPDTMPLPPVPRARYQRNVNQQIHSDVTKGPDPDKAYFRGPRNYVRISDGAEGPLFDRHNHDPAIAECPNGDLLAIWYSTVTERGRELALAASRLRRGADEWEEASPFFDAPDRNDHGPALWYDGEGTLFHFNGLSDAATWGPCAVIMRTSKDNGVSWSRTRFIVPEHQRRNQVVESIIRTQEGYLVLPCDASPSGSGGTAIHVSKDNGLTWTDYGGRIAGIHAAVSQLKDGRLIAIGRGDEVSAARPWMVADIRGKVDKAVRCMPMSISDDFGKSWKYHQSGFPPVGGGQRPLLLRLKEGPLFLGGFARKEDEGRTVPPVVVTDISGKKRAVAGLYGALSYDEGKTWPTVRLITDDGPAREVGTTNGKRSRGFTMSKSSAEPKGYMSICQGLDGVIHVISSWNHYAFNLKWLETPPPALD